MIKCILLFFIARVVYCQEIKNVENFDNELDEFEILEDDEIQDDRKYSKNFDKDSFASLRRGGSASEEYQCRSKLQKLDYRYRKCETETEKSANELMATAKKLQKIQKYVQVCERKKTCKLESFLDSFKSAAHEAWRCMGDIFSNGHERSSNHHSKYIK